MSEIIAEHRQGLVDELGFNVEGAAMIDTGGLRAQGFPGGVEAHADIWVEPADQELAETFGMSIDQIAALQLPAGSEEFAEYLAIFHPGAPLSRDEIVNAALFAVQMLRIYWLDNAPKPTTRRVEATPGRNDPCPCGSVRNFKKRHGAG